MSQLPKIAFFLIKLKNRENVNSGHKWSLFEVVVDSGLTVFAKLWIKDENYWMNKCVKEFKSFLLIFLGWICSKTCHKYRLYNVHYFNFNLNKTLWAPLNIESE